MCLVTLDRAYPSRFGAPRIDRVDTEIFVHRYFADCMGCDFCHDVCCSYGADIDLGNAERIYGLGAAFAESVGIPPARWFDGRVIDDDEFPGGKMMRVCVKDGHCVFLDTGTDGGRGCKLHSYCLTLGLDYHVYKPAVCFLFGVTFEYGALVPSNEIRDASLVCHGQGPTVFEAVRGELTYFFGDGLAAALERVRDGL